MHVIRYDAGLGAWKVRGIELRLLGAWKVPGIELRLLGACVIQHEGDCVLRHRFFLFSPCVELIVGGTLLFG